MAQTSNENKNIKQQVSTKSSWEETLARFNSIMGQFAGLPLDSFYGVFGRAMSNMAPIQNSRIKAISPLPCDYTKYDLGEFLRKPQSNETALQQVAEGLRWSTYSFQKLVKSYADMLEFHSIVLPQYVMSDEIKSDAFKREVRLVDKFIKKVSLKEEGRKIAMQAETQGKVYYVPRYSVDKSHNEVNYFFLQELPKQWCTIIGKNSVSGWTVSFDLMYFSQIGTDFRQFGDLFEPYMTAFATWQKDKKSFRGKYIYATRNNAREESEVKAWMQNGRWFYYVSLPIERVWTFEIDKSTAIVASPLAGLMQTFAQQADYEAAQLPVILNSLIKIFTGEIPYNDRDNATQEDSYKLSIGGLRYFVEQFNSLMRANQTAGVGFYGAPFQNIRAWDYPEASNANEISRSYLSYGLAKSGAQGVIPIDDRPTEEAVKASEKLEPKYAQSIYGTFERMLNFILNEDLSLRFSWKVKIFGDIYSDEQVRADCLKLIDKGSTYSYLTLCALDDISLLDMLSMSDMVNESGLLDKLRVPPTSFTQSGNSQLKSDTGGAPVKDEASRTETVIEKETQGATEDGDE